MKHINIHINKKAGFSLIEVLVFVTILSLVFITAAAVGTVSIRNSQNSEKKIIATRYAEELHDWLSAQKEIDWLSFVSRSSSAGTKYCFGTEPVSSPWPAPASGSCSGQLINGLFTREVTLTYDNNSRRVSAFIDVSWSLGGNKYDVPINGIFAEFE